MEAISNLVDSKITARDSHTIIWLKSISLKVARFVWRVKLGKIMVVDALIKRSFQINSIQCRLCDTSDEKVNHTLISCFFASSVIEWIFKWCGIPYERFLGVTYILDFGSRWGNCPKKWKTLSIILYGLIW